MSGSDFKDPRGAGGVCHKKANISPPADGIANLLLPFPTIHIPPDRQTDRIKQTLSAAAFEVGSSRFGLFVCCHSSGGRPHLTPGPAPALRGGSGLMWAGSI